MDSCCYKYNLFIAARVHYTVPELIFVSVNYLYMSRDLAEKSLKEENNSEEHLASYYFRTASA